MSGRKQTADLRWTTDDNVPIDLYYFALTGTGGVTRIIAGTNVTVSPTGGTGVVTVNATSQAAARHALVLQLGTQQDISSSFTPTTVAFGSNSTIMDSDTGWDSTNNQYVVQAGGAGLWSLSAALLQLASSSNLWDGWFEPNIASAGYTIVARGVLGQQDTAEFGVGYGISIPSFLVSLNAGDTFRLRVAVNSGCHITTGYNTWMCATRISA